MELRSAVACAIFFLSFHANAQTYLNCDFSEGIPSDFTLIDNDKNSPSTSMADMGFSVGVPWIAVAPTGESGMAACSTSWYSPAGQADDWMITPAISIPSDNVVLTWRAKASDKRHRDGYAVYVSETGGKAISDFDMDAPLFSVSEEENAWTSHTVSLQAFKGKTISLAFVNNSTDKSRLYVDDIFVGVSTAAFVKLDVAKAVAYQGCVEVSGVAYTNNDEPVTGYTIGLEYGDTKYQQEFSGTLTKGEEQAFTLDEGIELGWHETANYTVWIEAAGTRYEYQGHVTSYPQRIVCEDVTGTWCGYCVRGMVSLDNLRKNYADKSIGLAAHSGDVMYDELTGYLGNLSQVVSWSGLPAGIVNRKYSCDPGNFSAYVDYLMGKEAANVAIKLDAVRDKTTNEVSATTHLWFADNQTEANLRIAYVLIENRIHQPGNDDYKQHNSYAGGEYGEMGGYENLPEYISADDMYYDDVVRCTIGDFNGYEGSIPAAITAEEEIAHEVSFSLPSTVINAEETELVALIIDQSDHHIINAAKCALGESALGVSQLRPSDDAATIVSCYNTAGVRLSSPQHGINILRYSDGTTRKVYCK